MVVASKKVDLSQTILEHAWVPKHEVISVEEAESVLKKHSTTLENMPKILKNDPIVKIIKAEPGDMVKITRRDKSSYYRVVV